MQELLEQEENFRYTMMPIKFSDLFDFYKKARASAWIPEELQEEMGKDTKGWKTLSSDIRNFIKTIVAFFAISDGVVGEIISEEIANRIEVREVKTWYNEQARIEDIHSEIYSQLAEVYVEDPDERNSIFESIKNYPVIRRKIEWLHKWVGRSNPFRHIPQQYKPMLKDMARMHQHNMGEFLRTINYATELADPVAPIPRLDEMLNYIIEDNTVPLAQVILANAIMEGLFFSGSFCSIFWLNHYYGGTLPGLSKANEWISRDEGMHTDYAIILYRRYIINKLSEQHVHMMLSEAVEIESDFIAEALPRGLKGMNSILMTQYIKFVADQLLGDLGYNKLYGEKNPFEFMDKQSISVRIPDFFMDQSVSEYGIAQDNGLRFDENF